MSKVLKPNQTYGLSPNWSRTLVESKTVVEVGHTEEELDHTRRTTHSHDCTFISPLHLRVVNADKKRRKSMALSALHTRRAWETREKRDYVGRKNGRPAPIASEPTLSWAVHPARNKKRTRRAKRSDARKKHNGTTDADDAITHPSVWRPSPEQGTGLSARGPSGCGQRTAWTAGDQWLSEEIKKIAASAGGRLTPVV